MTQLDEIQFYFSQNHINLKTEWLQEVIKFLLNVKKITGNLLDLVYHQWLFSTIELTTEAFNQFEYSENIYLLPQPVVFQIQSLTDIGTSKHKQHQRRLIKDYDEGLYDFDDNNNNNNNVYKCILLEIFDGQRIFKAFEQKRIFGFSLSIQPGSKILIFGGTLIKDNVIFLNQKNCQLLGGAVEQLLQESHDPSITNLIRPIHTVQLDEIQFYFSQNHINLKTEWLQEVIKFLLNVKKITGNLLDLVYHQWLFSNIELTTEAFNQFDYSENIYSLPQPVVFQIQSLTDIGTSKHKQHQRRLIKDYDEGLYDFDDNNNNNVYKCILLEVFDGQRIFKAFEQKRIFDLSLSIQPGSKILIFGGTLIKDDVIFLNQKNCQLLGGAVEEQENSLNYSMLC